MNKNGPMREAEHERLRSEIWRRELTPAEREAFRNSAPAGEDAAALLESEEQLTRVLHSAPRVQASSNFTSRVLAQVRLEQTQALRAQRQSGVRQWLPRLRSWLSGSWAAQVCTLAVLVTLGAGSMFGLRTYEHAQIVRTVEMVREASAIPEIEALKDFDAIRHLGGVREPVSTLESDAALLAALQ